MTTATIQEAALAGASARPAKDIDHLDGCPADRVERYEQRRPSDGQAVTTTRCIDCGSQRVDLAGRVTRQKERTDA